MEHIRWDSLNGKLLDRTVPHELFWKGKRGVEGLAVMTHPYARQRGTWKAARVYRRLVYATGLQLFFTTPTIVALQIAWEVFSKSLVFSKKRSSCMKRLKTGG